MHIELTITECQHEVLMQHLFPEDGCEAVAIGLCGRYSGEEKHRLLLRKLTCIPYDICKERLPDRVTWPTEFLVPLLAEAEKYGLAIVKFHGHSEFENFSDIDDLSDRQLFPSVYNWTESELPHASVIVMRNGSIFGRVVTPNGRFCALDTVSVIGDDIKISALPLCTQPSVPQFGYRIAQTFGTATFEKLRSLRIGVVGYSGTGSPVVEQLTRNCVGSLIIVDPDKVEEKNLNRILNTTMVDAKNGEYKVNVAARTINAMGLGTVVKTHVNTLFDLKVIHDLASCDVLFGCMDSIDGRYLLNKLASFYMIPYFDLGVKIEADGHGGVNQVCGTVHYLKPGGSSLLSRNVFTLEQVRAAGLKRTNPEQYKELLEEGYIRGVQENRPAVIQLNSLIASIAVNELLARLHPYRSDPNGDFAVSRVSLVHGFFDHEDDGIPCSVLSRHMGRGDIDPPLDWVELTKKGVA